MRGPDRRAEGLFSYVSCERRVPAEHPLRSILPITDAALAALSGEFQQLYARNGRPSIAPEKLLRALLLQAFYSSRSERQLMERLDFDLLFRWFVGLGIDDPVWDHSTFSKNRDRLLAGDVAAEFLATLLERPKVRRLLSSEHFSVDGTLIQAWASIKSFQPQDDVSGPPDDAGFYRGRGCKKCLGTGYAGRVPIYEIMVVTPAVAQGVENGLPTIKLRELAAKEGMVELAACSWILPVCSRSRVPVESMMFAVVWLSAVIWLSTSRWLAMAWATVTAVRSAPTVVVLARSTPLTSSTLFFLTRSSAR
jgi:transposase